jgi:hypothetical protein
MLTPAKTEPRDRRLSGRRPEMMVLCGALTLIALQFADWFLTVFVLELGGAELSPIMAPIFGWGYEWALVFKLLGILAITLVIIGEYLATRKMSDVYQLLLFANFVAVLPVIWNSYQLWHAIQMGG